MFCREYERLSLTDSFDSVGGGFVVNEKTKGLAR